MTEAENLIETDRVISKADWARRLAMVGAVVGPIAIAFAIWAIIVNTEQDADINRIERSACTKSAESKECQRVTREAAEARSIADTCIAFWKVGYPCPAPGTRDIPAGRDGSSGEAFKPSPFTTVPADGSANQGARGDPKPVSQGQGGQDEVEPGQDDPDPQTPAGGDTSAPPTTIIVNPGASPPASSPPAAETTTGNEVEAGAGVDLDPVLGLPCKLLGC